MLRRTASNLLLALVLTGLLMGCDSAPEEEPIVIPAPLVVAASDFTTTQSGLRYYDHAVGEGLAATDGSTARHHYTVWFESGTLIESSYTTGSPVTIVVGAGEVIEGWDEGLLGMQKGGYRQLVIPPALAYGENGSASLGIPANTTLIIEIALLDVTASDN